MFETHGKAYELVRKWLCR